MKKRIEDIMTSSRLKKILLATDMSARSDRALSRAAMLATEFRADLSLAYAIEADVQESALVPSWRRKSNAREILEQKIKSELEMDGMHDVTLHVHEGRPEDIVLAVSRGEKSDLIVTGVARHEPFGRILVGNTASSLVRHADVPVLVVKKRPRAAYKHIVVATDLSESSKIALHKAMDIFPAENITVFHAYTAPYADSVDEKDVYVEDIRKGVKVELDTFLTDTIGAERAASIKTLIEYGSPADILSQYVLDHHVDLVVTGTHGRTGLSSILLGSVADSLLALVPTDILVARG